MPEQVLPTICMVDVMLYSRRREMHCVFIKLQRYYRTIYSLQQI
jgi:hypothetical protein